MPKIFWLDEKFIPMSKTKSGSSGGPTEEKLLIEWLFYIYIENVSSLQDLDTCVLFNYECQIPNGIK